MTANEINEERTAWIIIPYTATPNYVKLDKSAQNLYTQFLDCNSPTDTPSLKGDMAAWCMDTIVRNEDLMESWERIRRDSVGEESGSDTLARIKIMTAESIFLNSKMLLGKGILKI